MGKNKISSIVFYFSILVFIIAFNFAHNPPSGWYQQFVPYLGIRPLSDITFTDSLTGYAVTPYVAQNDTAFVLKTTNGGDNWFNIKILAGEFVGFSRIHFINNATGFILGVGLLEKTTNAGSTWIALGIPKYSNFNDFAILSQDTIWIAEDNSLIGGVFRTTNGGASWQQQLYLGSQNPTNIYFYNKDIGFVAENVLYKTTNSGLNWLQIPGGGFGDMHFINATTGWKCYGLMQKTTDGGVSWINQPLPQGGNIILSQMREFSNVNDDTIWGIGGHVFYPEIGNRGMIYRTTNGGNNWLYQVPDNNINIGVYRFIDFYNQHTGWAYSGGPGVHTIVGGDSIFYPITSISQISSEIPSAFKLYQNYPNPFNPFTTIKYELKKNAFVKLAVFDIAGREVKSIVNERQNTGVYEAQFSATEFGSSISSGVYFYKLVADGKIIDTKKMIVLK